MQLDELPAITDDQLRPCDGCGCKILHAGPTFWLLRPVRAVVDLASCRERFGLAMLFHGNEVIARQFAARPLARTFDQAPFGGTGEILLCEHCACTRPVASLIPVETAHG